MGTHQFLLAPNFAKPRLALEICTFFFVFAILANLFGNVTSVFRSYLSTHEIPKILQYFQSITEQIPTRDSRVFPTL